MTCRHPFSAIAGLAFASFVGLAGCPARASVPAGGQPLTVGMNFVNPGRLTVAQQDQILAEMKAAGVKVIRCGISADETSLDKALASIQDVKNHLHNGCRDWNEHRH
jgi:hypothetical protein